MILPIYMVGILPYARGAFNGDYECFSYRGIGFFEIESPNPHLPFEKCNFPDHPAHKYLNKMLQDPP